MPKVSMNYQNNIIYKIQHKTIDELIYIGSTTNFAKRKYSHKSNSCDEKHKSYNEKKYVMIRKNGGWDMFNMVLVKKYPCNDFLEARQEEERMRRELNANMNTNLCFRTEEDIKECSRIKYKKYRETHKEERKQYYESHKEEFKAKSKQYYETNKEEERLRRKKKVECECGCIVSAAHIAKHRKSQKHLKLLNEKVEIV
jgi:hypothetical protein